MQKHWSTKRERRRWGKGRGGKKERAAVKSATSGRSTGGEHAASQKERQGGAEGGGNEKSVNWKKNKGGETEGGEKLEGLANRGEGGVEKWWGDSIRTMKGGKRRRWTENKHLKR